MKTNEISKFQTLLSKKILLSEESFLLTLSREYKEKILIIAFNFIYNSKFFKSEKGDENLDFIEKYEENQMEIIIASSMIVFKVYADNNCLNLLPNLIEYSIDNKIDFNKVIQYEVGILQYFDWNLNEIISPNEIFEVLFYYLNLKLNSYNKDLLLDFFNTLFDEIVFRNLNILLKFNIGILSASIFYYALSSVEDMIEIDSYKNFILAFLIFPAFGFDHFIELQHILKKFSKNDIEYFSSFISKIDGCCNVLYEFIIL